LVSGSFFEETALNRFRHPEGTRLPALERNILKFRAFEMVLLLFYSEYLKQQIIGTIEASDRWTRKDHPRVTADTKKKFQKATATLVADGIITKEEKDEIGKLVDVRNTIAHNIHEMTFDVSRDTYARQRLEVERPKYDYDALKRIKYFYKELSKRMMSKYTQVLSMDRILFQAAERTYETELKRLNKKIVA
jgi:hypothetical protein